MKNFLFVLIMLRVVHVQAQDNTALLLSDIHLNINTIYTRFYPADLDTVLFNNSVKEMSEGDTYKYILITGDLLCHAMAHSTSEIEQTLDYIVRKLKRRFPFAIVIPALGNNDFREHNNPDEESYEVFYNSMLKNIDNQEMIKHTFLEGGYYSYTNNDLTIIVLNSILFTKKNDKGDEQMKWFADILSKCRSKVWVLYHIPPGIDSYYKLTKNTNVDCWAPDYQETYLHEIIEHKDIIKFQLSGHFHMDDYRFIKDSKGSVVSYLHIAPALSTRNGNNLAYQSLTYKQHDYVPLNIRTYFKDSCCAWRLEYDFKQTYKIAPSVGFYKLINNNNEYKKLYETYYSVSKPILPYNNQPIHWSEFMKDAILELKR